VIIKPLGLVAFSLTVLVNCGGNSAEESTSVVSFAPNGETITIQSLDNSFRPVEFEIEAGTEVIFENRGRNDHNILPDSVANDEELTALLASSDAPTSWGVVAADFVPGDTFSHLFTVPGTYSYYCSIHGSPGAGMYGVLVVTDPSAG
jgi:plastocyanin